MRAKTNISQLIDRINPDKFQYNTEIIKNDEKYDIVTRAIFYCARMISAQHGTEFVNSNYQDIKKVYSIWICPNVPKRVEYTITSHKIVKKDICGEVPDED